MAPATHTEHVTHIARSELFVSTDAAIAVTPPITNIGGNTAANEPPAVATPLPPRNRAQTGKQCPTIAAVAAVYAPASPAMSMPSSPAIAPFSGVEHDHHHTPRAPDERGWR